jgi:hypothetical protein
MADGYARVSRRIGVATVHQGPGLTNAMTGLAEAAKARTPLVVLAADTSASAVHSNFRIDQDALVTSVGAVAERLHTPGSALRDVARAVRRAVTDRRTVALMLPLDVQAADAGDDHTLPGAPAPAPPAPSATAIRSVVDLLADARRPAIIAGRGAVLAGAREPLEELGERIGAVLATSANGNGLFAGHPFAVGIAGGFASPLAAELLAGADLLLMPSLYEPCGLTQMRAQRYGAIPVARRVGGLLDSIVDGETGVLFSEYVPAGLEQAVERALAYYRDRTAWRTMVRHAMAQSFGWDGSAARYLDVYRRALAARLVAG